MIVTTVSATIRYSQDTGKGAWKVIELGAEASISDREFWQQSQSELYYQLSHQLRQLWHSGSGAALNGAGGAEAAVEPASEPAPVSGGRKARRNTGARSIKRPLPSEMARVESPGGVIRRRTGVGAGNSGSPLSGEKDPGEGLAYIGGGTGSQLFSSLRLVEGSDNAGKPESYRG